jgi:DNA processing protein
MNYIVKNGAVISEYPPGASPNSINFPARNRIISGMSFATLVIEAGEKSGSLITADFALEQGRSVFAVPGNIDVLSSKGTNNLIKQGAKLISSIEDIIEEIPEYIIDKLQKHKSNNNFTKTVHDNDKGTISDKGLFGDREIFNNKLGLNSTMILGDIEISTEERQILECLSNIPLHIEELSTRSGLGMQELNSILTLLEMKGIINQLVGRTFVRTM